MSDPFMLVRFSSYRFVIMHGVCVLPFISLTATRSYESREYFSSQSSAVLREACKRISNTKIVGLPLSLREKSTTLKNSGSSNIKWNIFRSVLRASDLVKFKKLLL
jgi:hypothetical protein